MLRLFVLSAAALAALAPPAAGIVYSQPPDFPTEPGFYAYTSSFAPGFATASGT